MTRILYHAPAPADQNSLLATLRAVDQNSRLGLDAATRLAAFINQAAALPQLPTPTPQSPIPNLQSPIEETEALAEAGAIIDGQPLAELRQLALEQNRLADTLAQAMAWIEEVQTVSPAPLPPPAQAPELQSSLPPELPPPAAGSTLPPVYTTVPAAVALQARQILAANPLFLDYETTGLRRSIQVHETAPGQYTTLNAKYHQAVEVSVLSAAGRPVFHSWLNPQRPIPDNVVQTHGLDTTQLANSPTWPEVAPILRRILSGRTVVAHNAKFDALFTPPEWDITWACTYDLANQAFGKYDHFESQFDWRKKGGLNYRLQQCGLKPGPAHTAAGDSLSTLRLLRYLAGLEQII